MNTMDTLTIRWERSLGEPSRIVYYVDDFAVGEDDIGFDEVLAIVRSNRDRQVVLKIGYLHSLGGNRLIDALPFKDRFSELTKALDEHRLIYEFM